MNKIRKFPPTETIEWEMKSKFKLSGITIEARYPEVGVIMPMSPYWKKITDHLREKFNER